MSNLLKSPRWLGAIALVGTIAIVSIAMSIQAQPNSSQTPHGTWEYNQFIQAVEKKTVRKVGVNVDRTRLLVETKDGKRVWVNVKNDPTLIETLTRNDVDIYVMADHSKVQRTPRETWRYSQFIEAVEKKTVQKVRISADRTRLIAEAKDGRRAWVNLPSDPELINILTRNQVDIVVVPAFKEPVLNP